MPNAMTIERLRAGWRAELAAPSPTLAKSTVFHDARLNRPPEPKPKPESEG
jgi:hypothetical protein